MESHRIYSVSFASVYPYYIAKVIKKGRTKQEADKVICWLTGYSQTELESQIVKQVDFETFYSQAPAKNPKRKQIKGKICGVQIDNIQDPLMKEIRYLDKLIDELAKGKDLDKILM